jgi:hypothetical protein
MTIDLNQIAEAYVRLVLSVGKHDADYVDAYYGPAEIAASVNASTPTLAEIHAGATDCIHRLTHNDLKSSSHLDGLRHQYLVSQCRSLASRVEILEGKRLSFDDEAKALYDVTPPTFPEEHFQRLLKNLESLLPGTDPLSQRMEAFRQHVIIPPDRLDAVFQAAIAECRVRTLKQITLPANEQFDLEYVHNKSWSGYNWFKGNAHSLIQINVDLPIFLDRAIDLAAHEGYPGHHVYNSLLESELVRKRGWIEFSVYALFSPQSLIAEGTANFGIEVAFPGNERIGLEEQVLAPLARISAEIIPTYGRILAITAQLSYAGNEAARRYLDGVFTRDQAADWLVTYALMSPERAQQRIRFFDQYRSYVINYNLGQDLVRKYIEANGGTADLPKRRWEVFTRLISSPRLPSGLSV